VRFEKCQAAMARIAFAFLIIIIYAKKVASQTADLVVTAVAQWSRTQLQWAHHNYHNYNAFKKSLWAWHKARTGFSPIKENN